MKKFISKKSVSILLASLTLATSIPVSALADINNNNIKVYVDGAEVSFDQPPVIENNRTLVPFRAVLEKMGVSVDWDNETRTITATNSTKKINLTIGNNTMVVDDDMIIKLDAPAKIENNRTLVPLRAISESLGAKVDWNATEKTIKITTDNSSNQINNSDTTAQNQTSNTKTSTETASDKIIDSDKKLTLVEANINYPVFSGNTTEIANINKKLKAAAEKIVSDFIQENKEYTEEFSNDDLSLTVMPFVATGEYEITYIDDEKVSIVTTVVYNTGGAHPSTIKIATTYSFKTGNVMALKDMVADKDSVLATATNGFKAMINENPEEFFEDALETLNIDDAIYYLTDNGIMFEFGQYAIAPYARGFVKFEVPIKK